MPDPMLDLAAQFRADLLRKERAAAVRLTRTYGEIWRRLQPQVDALNVEIAAMQSPTAAKVLRLARFQALQSAIDAELRRYGAWADTEIMASAQSAAQDGENHSRELALAALPAALRAFGVWRNVPAQAVEPLLPFLQGDSPLHAALTEELGPSVNQVVTRNVEERVGTGRLNVTSAIRAAIGAGLAWVARTARTVALWAYRETTRANYIANSEIVGGWVWFAQLDDRCCVSCVVMHGTEHPNTVALNDHHNGRCMALPIVAGRRPNVEPDAGRQWFNTLDDRAQQNIMGRAAWKAYQDGAIEWSQLSTIHDDPVYGPMRVAPSLKALLGEDGAAQYYGWWRK